MFFLFGRGYSSSSSSWFSRLIFRFIIISPHSCLSSSLISTQKLSIFNSCGLSGQVFFVWLRFESGSKSVLLPFVGEWCPRLLILYCCHFWGALSSNMHCIYIFFSFSDLRFCFLLFLHNTLLFESFLPLIFIYLRFFAQMINLALAFRKRSGSSRGAIKPPEFSQLHPLEEPHSPPVASPSGYGRSLSVSGQPNFFTPDDWKSSMPSGDQHLGRSPQHRQPVRTSKYDSLIT